MRAHVQHKGGRRKSKRKKCVINIFRATEMRRDATQRNAMPASQPKQKSMRVDLVGQYMQQCTTKPKTTTKIS